METKRETKEITTVHKNVVIVYSYATGGECNKIESKYLEGSEINVVNGMTNVTGIKSNAEDNVRDEKISLLVVSIDGDSTNVLKSMNDLQQEDYSEVLLHLNSITKKKEQIAEVLK